MPTLSRRSFSGLVVTIPLLAQEPGRLPTRTNNAADLNAYLRIGSDGRVTCLVGKVELGQGAVNSLAQVLADELDVRFDAVEVLMGDTALCPYDMGTFGSMTTPYLVPPLRQAGATARTLLLQRAADRLQLPMGQLVTKEGRVYDTQNAAISIPYSDLVQDQRIEQGNAGGVPTKTPPHFTVIGTSPVRKDALEKVTGRAVFAGDQLPPGLLHARLLRPPALGAKLISADTSAAEALPGVKVVKLDNLIAVLHERPDLATAALATVKAEFAPHPAEPTETTISGHLQKTAPKPTQVAKTGDIAAGRAASAHVLESTFHHAYGAHAPMETHSATVVFRDGRFTVYASTQAPFQVQGHVARAAKVDPSQVRVITRYVGGGFGGKTEADQAVEAALLARATGAPVQVVYSRAEEFLYDRYRPAAVSLVRSGLDSNGKLTFWDNDIIAAGDREAKPFYDVPNLKITSAGSWQGGNPAGMHPFQVGAWRAPSVNTNTFARECHLDALALQAGLDPVDLRLRNLSNPRMRRVLETAVKTFGYQPAPRPSKRGIGVACGQYSNAMNATIAEVAVSPEGQVRVKRVVMALDAGLVLNPDGLRQQVEGSVIMGLGLALYERIRFQGGQPLTTNFDDFRLPRFSDLPKMEIVFVDDKREPALGGGEPPIVTLGPALANAVFDATGKRLYALPMLPEHVKG